MVLEGKGRIFRRPDGKYFLYLPKSVAEDSAFPFKIERSLPVQVVIDLPHCRVLVMPLKENRLLRRKRLKKG